MPYINSNSKQLIISESDREKKPTATELEYGWAYLAAIGGHNWKLNMPTKL